MKRSNKKGKKELTFFTFVLEYIRYGKDNAETNQKLSGLARGER